MARLLSLLTIVLAAAPALAQEGTMACEPEIATLTIEVPTGRCAARAPSPQPLAVPQQPSAPQAYAAPSAPQAYAPQPYAPQPYAPQAYAPPYYPQPYYPQAYAPPYYPQPYYAPPPSLEPPAPQFRTEEREIRGLWIAGLALWAATWIADWTVTGLAEEREDLRNVAFVPIVGPWIQLAMGQGAGSSGGETLLIADGIAQAAGAVMILVGALVKREVRVRERAPRWSLGVAPTQGGGALALSGTF
jgi:hypothetical protein